MPNNHFQLEMIDPVMQLDCIRFFIKKRYDKANTNRTFIMDNIEDAYGFKIGNSVKMFEFILPDCSKNNHCNYCVFVGNTKDIEEMYKYNDQCGYFNMYGEYLNDEGQLYKVVGILNLDMLMKRDYIQKMAFPDSIVGTPTSIFDYYCDNSRWLYMFMNEYVLCDRSVSYDILRDHIIFNDSLDNSKIDKIASEIYSYLIDRKWGKVINLILKYGNFVSRLPQYYGFISDFDDEDDENNDDFII